MRFRFRIFLFAVFYFLTVSLWADEKPLLPTSFPLTYIPPVLKIALQVDVPAVSITIPGPFEIRSLQGEPFSVRGDKKFQANIGSVWGGIRFQDKVLRGSAWEFSGLAGEVKVGSRNYGRTVRILKRDKGLTIVHDAGIEEYLRGVLPLEVSASWPKEALKAQAVISRTFALFKAIEKKDQDFMLQDTVMSQVYGGSGSHRWATDQAISQTAGEILTFNGEIFPAYFHSSCGGITARAQDLWAVVPNFVFENIQCPFCKGSPSYEWSLKVPLKQIESIMQKNGYPAKNLKLISLEDRDVSGRARKVVFQYENSQVAIDSETFRDFLGMNKFKSLKADVWVSKGAAHFHGFGWGHGIGFCQWGAKKQAQAGRNYKEILSFYFPKSTIKKL